jgi:hypothetical protein
MRSQCAIGTLSLMTSIGKSPLRHVSTLVFEVPDVRLATELAAHLEDQWACCAFGDTDAPVTVVFLSHRGDADFAQLVRRVANWVGEHGLGELPLRLHGRAFIRAQPRLELHVT